MVLCSAWSWSAGVGAVLAGRQSPGMAIGVPYTNSAGLQLRSSFTVVLRPNNTHGSWSYQLGSVNLALRASFSLLCIRSTNPFACGW